MEGRQRVVVENVQPGVDRGRFAVKRVVGDWVTVQADVFADGHDVLAALVQYRLDADETWNEVAMSAGPNDCWTGMFLVDRVGRFRFRVLAWIDRFGTWQRDMGKRIDARQDIRVDLEIGAELIEKAAARSSGQDGDLLREAVQKYRGADASEYAREIVRDDGLASLMAKWDGRHFAVASEELSIVVDRFRARFGAWYELFPRSCSDQTGAHGTLGDCANRLAYVASMGFDVVYLPPIHPIGVSYRKGKNNAVNADDGSPGSPWAIGSRVGDHCSIHPELGTIEDFRALLERARGLGLEVAMDLAFQCSPDHPWVHEHPEWFLHRPDGSIQYAENPPKKYQDIYPIDFETERWSELWHELKGVVDYWVETGIRFFRVDNPHTKAFSFWEWLITVTKERYPDVLFLAEAFTRPKVMYRLAKLGFSQSYNYFPWRNRKAELVDYFRELTQTDVREYFRANLWPNTPDILTEYLQYGGRPAFQVRLVLAATLGATYGIYGPAFELGEHQAAEPGREEYLNSEKYEIRNWNLDDPWSLRDFITRVNRVRRENPALQQDGTLRFHQVDNENLIAYSKTSDDKSNAVVVVVNLDPHHRQSGWLDLDLAELGVPAEANYQMHDQLSDARFLWRGPRNFVELDPGVVPAQIFRVRRHERTEREFEYYL